MNHPFPPPVPNEASEFYGTSEFRENLRHSGMGIASFILSLVGGGGLLALFIVAGVVEVSTPGGMNAESPIAIVIGMFLIVAFLMELLAIGLGIAGYFQKNRKVLFAVLGSIFAGVGLFGAIALMVIGQMAG